MISHNKASRTQSLISEEQKTRLWIIYYVKRTSNKRQSKMCTNDLHHYPWKWILSMALNASKEEEHFSMSIHMTLLLKKVVLISILRSMMRNWNWWFFQRNIIANILWSISDVIKLLHIFVQESLWFMMFNQFLRSSIKVTNQGLLVWMFILQRWLWQLVKHLQIQNYIFGVLCHLKLWILSKLSTLVESHNVLFLQMGDWLQQLEWTLITLSR